MSFSSFVVFETAQDSGKYDCRYDYQALPGGSIPVAMGDYKGNIFIVPIMPSEAIEKARKGIDEAIEKARKHCCLCC